MNPELEKQINQHIAQSVEQVHASYRDIVADLVRQISELSLSGKFKDSQIQALSEQLEAANEQIKELTPVPDTREGSAEIPEA